ncbi:serine/threonine protein kinase [Phormidium sp. CCY1219]|uniref:serine/threonine protein kinase n=1 Tax=Phormidium sp. CCY1219 TaxID=2886104 RepID=UPI002D1ECC0A|nr:serine/threonine protein kinase [Phormidium sp. CCY1219]MEB3826586.1 serine/threonine protein kinase [Phormidium sp. CCY1219]
MSSLAGLGKLYQYTAYGLTLEANHPLPGLISAKADAPVDIWVELNGVFELPSPDVEEFSSGVNLISKEDGTYFHLWFRGDGQIDFEIDSEGSHIFVSWERSVIEEITAMLLGPALACALRLRGTLCLHACVVGIGGQAIAIVGESGVGKSTTAATLASRGYAILSDDIAVVCSRAEYFFVQPGYPRIRLWPKTINALYGSEADLPRVFSFSEKRFVDLRDNSGSTALSASSTPRWQFQGEPLPLAAIYVLEPRQPGLAKPTVEPIPPAMAVMELMAQRSANHLKLDMDKQAREFAALSRVATTVPVRKITRSDSLEALPQLCDAIVKDVAGIVNSALLR